MKAQLIIVLVAASFFSASAFAAGDASFAPNTPSPNSPSSAPSSPSSAPSSWAFWKDDPGSGSGSGTGSLHGVPGPIVGAGLPFLLVGCGAYWLIKAPTPQKHSLKFLRSEGSKPKAASVGGLLHFNTRRL